MPARIALPATAPDGHKEENKMAFSLLRGFLPQLHPPTAAEPELCGQEKPQGMCPHGSGWSCDGTAPARSRHQQVSPAPFAPRAPAPEGSRPRPLPPGSINRIPSPWQPPGCIPQHRAVGWMLGTAQPSPEVPVPVLNPGMEGNYSSLSFYFNCNPGFLHKKCCFQAHVF